MYALYYMYKLVVLHLAKVKAHVRAYNSACLAKVNIGKDAATTTSKGQHDICVVIF